MEIRSSNEVNDIGFSSKNYQKKTDEKQKSGFMAILKEVHKNNDSESAKQTIDESDQRSKMENTETSEVVNAANTDTSSGQKVILKDGPTILTTGMAVIEEFKSDEEIQEKDPNEEMTDVALLMGMLQLEKAPQDGIAKELSAEMHLNSGEVADKTKLLSQLSTDSEETEMIEIPVISKETRPAVEQSKISEMDTEFEEMLNAGFKEAITEKKVDGQQTAVTDNGQEEVQLLEELPEKVVSMKEADLPENAQVAVIKQLSAAELAGSDLSDEKTLDSAELNGNSVVEGLSVNEVKTPDMSVVKPQASQVTQQIQDKILQNFDGEGQKVFKLTLNPENLGEVDVEMKVENGKMTINILAASQETHEILTKQIDQLIRGLALHKVQVETVTTNRTVEETADSGEQTQAGFTNMNFNQNQQQNQPQNQLIQGRFNRMGRIGSSSGESLNESLTELANVSGAGSRFNRLDYLI